MIIVGCVRTYKLVFGFSVYVSYFVWGGLK